MTLLLLGAGCSVDQGLRSQSDPGGPLGLSPAKEQVRAGLAEIVLTDRRWPSFNEAREHPIAYVADGSPLYLNIQSARPLGELALPADDKGRYRFSPYPHLFLHIGDDTSLRSLNTCYLTLSAQETAGRELVVPLAPPDNRPGGNLADCWLAAANAPSRGPRNYELRLAGVAGGMQTWLPVADLLAVEMIAADYSGGTPRYAAMLAAPMQTEVAQASASQPSAAPVATPQSSAAQPAVPRSAAAAETPPPSSGVPQASNPGLPPQAGTTQSPAPRAAVPQSAVPLPDASQTLPNATLQPATGPQATAPQATAPPANLPQATVPQATVPQATGPQAPIPQAPTPGISELRRDVAPAEPSVPSAAGSPLSAPATEARAAPAASAIVTPVAAASVEALPAVPAETVPLDSLPASEAPALRRERSTPPGQATARIVIYSPAGDAAADARAREIRGRLESRGEFYVDLRYVTTFDSADNIRIFFETDRDSAIVVRDRLVSAGSLPIRDFSEQRPLPSPGTIELWLASPRDSRAPSRTGALP